jgi:hypothetical protein
MAVIEYMLGKRVHLPQLETQPFAALAAGSAADPAAGLETPMAWVPDPSMFLPPTALYGNVQGLAAKMRLIIEYAAFASNGAAATVGATAHYADLQLVVYRFQSLGLPVGSTPAAYLQAVLAYYTLKVNTTLGTAVTAGSTQTVTPPSMTGIVPGTTLAVDSGATYELVKVISTTATTFMAFFGQTHGSGVAVTSILQPNTPIPFVLANGPVSTTGNGTVTSGNTKVITPNAVNGNNGTYGIHVGDKLLFDTVGSGVQETVTVLAVTLSTFTVNLVNGHTSGYPIVTATGALGTAQPNPAGSALFNGPRFELQPNDVLKLTRTSNDVTGIATPAGLFTIDWTPRDAVKI